MKAKVKQTIKRYAPHSIGGRLALGLGIAIALLWGLAAWSTLHEINEELREQSDESLKEAAIRLLPLAAFASDENQAAVRIVRARHEDEDLFSYILRDREGMLLLRSHDAEPDEFPERLKAGFAQIGDDDRFYTARTKNGDLYLTIREDLDERNDLLEAASTGMLRPMLFLVPASFALVWLVVLFSLRPMAQFGREIGARDANALDPIATANLPTEIDTVAKAMNQLFARLSQSLEQERHFAARAAHELRTPVAAALAQLQLVLAQTEDPIAKERLEQSQTAMRRLARLVNRLLDLSRAGALSALSDRPLDMRQLVELSVDSSLRESRQAEQNGSAPIIELDLPQKPVMTRADPDLLDILLRNLLENACRHGNKEKPIIISLALDGKLSVRNDSPAVSADVLATLGTAFKRGQSLAEGSGLGLSIVTMIARAFGSKPYFSSGQMPDGRGFEVSVQLPIERTQP